MQHDAPAKINLYLHVLGRRPDSYHLLDSLVVFTEICDRVEARASPELSLEIIGPFGRQLGNAQPDAANNSVLQAARLLRSHAGITGGAALTLHKYLPVASGIGGGSSDAAATLRLLARLWNLALTERDLRRLARPLGADMDACLTAQTLTMRGIGEEVTLTRPLPAFHLVLANPGMSLSTAAVFNRHDKAPSRAVDYPQSFATLASLIDFLSLTGNDLEPAAGAILPPIATVLEALRGQEHCLLARMSGSGATCFGIFENRMRADAAAYALQREHPAWWVRSTAVR